MKSTYADLSPFFAAAAVAMPFTHALSAQSNGDQIVDGIGETALIVRYPLDGTAANRSRNGPIPATEATFVDERRFGRVLSLTGGPDGLTLPVACPTVQRRCREKADHPPEMPTRFDPVVLSISDFQAEPT